MTYLEAISQGFPLVQVSATGVGDLYENIVWEAGAALPSKETLDAWIASNEADTSRHITVLALRNRFTTSEKIAIDLASLDNPNATMEQRALAAGVRVMMADIAVATFIDLDRADTRAGVQALETYGIIGAGRAAQILDTPPTAIELYKGQLV